MAYKPSIPKGTRDFSPDVLHRRNLIFGIIKEVYELFGYLPVETPSMENLETLTGKYGPEGDKLLFRILNSGDFLENVGRDSLKTTQSSQLAPLIADKGLRYDLTVPFARYVVQHRNELQFPFRRYQIQQVWRADRPQKGRYREFTQCDADVIGSDSLTNEADLIQMMDLVFSRLGFGVDIRINNRKILWGLSEVCGITEQFSAFTVIIDKLDKAGHRQVMDELGAMGISGEILEELEEVFLFKGGNSEKISLLADFLKASAVGTKGLEEMRQVLAYHQHSGTQNPVVVDITLARGLNYYTGTIFEVVARDIAFGSLCGGGRYDDLTGIFGVPGLSGVGISFGADRIYDVMSELHLFDNQSTPGPKVMFVNFGDREELYSMKALKEIRAAGIAAELYPEPAKVKKQMSYAGARNFSYVILAGDEEVKNQNYTIKTMATGAQQTLGMDELLAYLKP